MVMYNDIMVDIETTGTSPDRTAIIQLAAVKFDYETGAVDTSNYFDRCLNIPAHRFWDESTRQWWTKQKREILHSIFVRMEDPKLVIEDFSAWALSEPDQKLRFWAKPTSFDFSFVQSYHKDYDVNFPFHFRNAIDLNSFTRGLFDDPGADPIKSDFVGDAHNAIVDVLNQIGTVFKAKELFYAANGKLTDR